MADRANLTVGDLKRFLQGFNDHQQILVDKVDGVEENFCEANYVKAIKYPDGVYVAIGRTLSAEGVEI
jgi:hypothetical protein